MGTEFEETPLFTLKNRVRRGGGATLVGGCTIGVENRRRRVGGGVSELERDDGEWGWRWTGGSGIPTTLYSPGTKGGSVGGGKVYMGRSGWFEGAHATNCVKKSSTVGYFYF
jgi:hypothetical protein